MLAKMPKHPPGRPKENRLEDPTDLTPTLEALGITRWQSSRWQAEARQRQKEAGTHGKLGGRGKKKTLPKIIGEGFERHERETDTQLARAAGTNRTYLRDARMLDAERKAGEMLEKMPKHKGGRPAKNRRHDVTGFPVSYDELGIDKKYAERWQAEASVPEQHYHAYLADCR